MKADNTSQKQSVSLGHWVGVALLLFATAVVFVHTFVEYSEALSWLFWIAVSVGAVCLLPAERIGLWVAWALVFLAHIWLYEHCWVTPGTVLKLLSSNSPPGVTGVFAGFSAFGCLCLCIATFVSCFSDGTSGTIRKRHKVLILLGWAVFFAVCFIRIPNWLPHPLYVLLTVWGQYTLIHALVISSIKWLLALRK